MASRPDLSVDLLRRQPAPVDAEEIVHRDAEQVLALLEVRPDQRPALGREGSELATVKLTLVEESLRVTDIDRTAGGEREEGVDIRRLQVGIAEALPLRVQMDLNQLAIQMTAGYLQRP